MNTQTAAPFQSASLYVGDLNNEVTEGLLFEIFNRVGPVASIRVCRDAVTRRSLGYAYVNFHNVGDAERTLDTMNFTDIKGVPCRIMWSQRDPSLRKSGVGNVFIKNLAPSVDNKALFDTFSVFGNILSCKVATDENGRSKGYGYVHYETAEAASDAINKFDGCQIDDMEVSVIPFLRRQERATEVAWTNTYIKGFPETWDEEKLTSVFSVYGTLASISIAKDEEGKSKKFGFVDFSDHESASKAVEELNGKTFDDETGSFQLYAGKMQKKAERVRDLKTRINTQKAERLSKTQGLNLFVKNLDDTVTDEQFRDTFAAYGTITSARIMKDEQTGSKGFGFVCYSTPEEANRAVAELNGKLVKSKPIVVTLHQRREVRRAQLQANYGRRMAFPGQQPMQYMGMMYPGAGGPSYMQGGPQGAPPRYSPQMQFAGRGGNFAPQGGRMGFQQTAQGGGRGYPVPPYVMQQQPNGANGRGMMPMQGRGMPPMMMQQQQMGRGDSRSFRGGAPGGRGGAMPGRGMGQQMGQPMGQSMGQQMGQPQGGRGAPNVKFNAQARNQQQALLGMPMGGMPMPVPQMMPQMGGGGMGMGPEPLDDQMLAAADPQTQKNMIGERLYPLIMRAQPEQAGKITGMLLEMDNAELLHLLESPPSLNAKIEEALDVLKKHVGEAAM